MLPIFIYSKQQTKPLKKFDYKKLAYLTLHILFTIESKLYNNLIIIIRISTLNFSYLVSLCKILQYLLYFVYKSHTTFEHCYQLWDNKS